MSGRVPNRRGRTRFGPTLGREADRLRRRCRASITPGKPARMQHLDAPAVGGATASWSSTFRIEARISANDRPPSAPRSDERTSRSGRTSRPSARPAWSGRGTRRGEPPTLLSVEGPSRSGTNHRDLHRAGSFLQPVTATRKPDISGIPPGARHETSGRLRQRASRQPLHPGRRVSGHHERWAAAREDWFGRNEIAGDPRSGGGGVVG